MKNLAIARRYAKALLLIAKEDGQAEQYREELDQVAGLVEGDKALEQAICNPLYEAQGRKQVLQAVIDRLSLSQAVKSFLLLLFDKGRFGFLTSINDFYQTLADELKGVARASLVSATALPSETVEKIRSSLSQRTGKDILLEVEQDPSLIGGIVTGSGTWFWMGALRRSWRICAKL